MKVGFLFNWIISDDFGYFRQWQNVCKKSWSEILQINNDEIEEATDEFLDKQMKDAPAGTKYTEDNHKHNYNQSM